MSGEASEAVRGLERLCEAPSKAIASANWVRLARSAPGLERVEARFRGQAYTPHRHDTYAIGITLAGVQTFDYRGKTRHSAAGQVFVLHPDELHDGRAGDEAGFAYRILYVAPELVIEALGSPQLPFVHDPVSGDGRMRSAVQAALADLDEPLEDLQRGEIVLSLAEALRACCEGHRRAPSAIDMAALRRAREVLIEHIADGIGNRELETASGLDRWTLARQFHAAYGVSPHRYLISRRLDRARELILEGSSLAEAAHAAGFADQSHMTRQFRAAYGLPPGRWRSLIRPG